MNKGKMLDDRLEEMTDGMLEQFRTVRDRAGDIDEERKIADSLANMYGKVLKGYMVEFAYNVQGMKLPCESKTAIAG